MAARGASARQAPAPARYHERLLLPEERIRTSSAPHWMALVWRLLARLGQLAGLWVAARVAGSQAVARLLASPGLRELTADGPPPLASWVVRACGWLALAVAGLAVLDYLRWRSTVYLVTDQRLLHVSGVLVKSALDSPLDRITDIGLEQSWLARRLDYGDILVLRNREDGGNRLLAVERPLAFRQGLHRAREARVAPPALAASNLQAALRELLALREHDLVTAEEFESKKRELLARF